MREAITYVGPLFTTCSSILPVRGARHILQPSHYVLSLPLAHLLLPLPHALSA